MLSKPFNDIQNGKYMNREEDKIINQWGNQVYPAKRLKNNPGKMRDDSISRYVDGTSIGAR